VPTGGWEGEKEARRRVITTATNAQSLLLYSIGERDACYMFDEQEYREVVMEWGSGE